MLTFVSTVDAQAEQHMQDLRHDAELQHLKLIAQEGLHGSRPALLRRRRQHGDSRAARRR